MEVIVAMLVVEKGKSGGLIRGCDLAGVGVVLCRCEDDSSNTLWDCAGTSYSLVGLDLFIYYLFKTSKNIKILIYNKEKIKYNINILKKTFEIEKKIIFFYIYI